MEETFNPVRWGILGAARIADAEIIPALRKSAYCQPAAIGARSYDCAKEMADKHGIESAHGSYDEILQRKDVEAVYVALPNHVHVEWMKKAIAAGKHVLCEKPAFMNAAEFETLGPVDPALKVSEAFMVRNQPRWIELKRILASGQYGAVKSLSSTLSFTMENLTDFRLKPEFGGGAYFDLGCYLAMTSRYIFDTEPKRVFAAFNTGAAAVDLSSSVIMDFGGGRYSTFVVSFVQSAAQSLHIVCEKASIEVPQAYVPAPLKPSTIRIDSSSNLANPEVRTIEFAGTNQYEDEVTNFARAVRGMPAPYFGLEDARNNAAVADAVFSSAKNGTWCDVSART